MPFAEVSVNSPIPARQTYTYEIPPGLDLRPGQGVYVPFGPRVLQGIVVEVTEAPRYEDYRPIEGVIDATPLVAPGRLALARWMAERYVSALYPAVSLMLPPGFERKPLTVIEPGPNWDKRGGGLDQQVIVDEVRARGRVEIEDLKRAAGLKRNAPLLALINRGILSRSYQLDRPRVAPKTTTIVELVRPQGGPPEPGPVKRSKQADLLERLSSQPALSFVEARAIAGPISNLNKLVSAGQIRISDSDVVLLVTPEEALRRAAEMRSSSRVMRERATVAYLSGTGGVATYGELREATGVSRAMLDEMATGGVLRLVERQVERDPLSDRVYERRGPPELTGFQTRCAYAIESAINSASTARFLLHGVTGAGKTEVYLDALDAAVIRGKRGIVLVPEIALTPQTIGRFSARFPGRVAVFHSGLSAGELHDQWHGVRDGRYDVVIGTRSALFAPQPDLGLVVIDEEHEWTYKEAERQPAYDARDAAVRLCEEMGAVLVAGSATPRVESYHAALEGQWQLLKLDQRIAGKGGGVPTVIPLPPVTVVDLREELRAGNRSIFSRLLQESLRAAIGAGQQALLFLNRRGSAGFLLCRACGYVPTCSACGLAFSLHRDEERLVCHGCSRRRNVYASCPGCRGPYLKPMGAGTQRVEEEVQQLIPGVRVLRWDRDATGARGAHERILGSFLAGEADVLVGTQMLAKGLDMPRVSLAGVVNADIGLNLPDFRSAEKTFQLLAQVAGRAGRAENTGSAIFQTYLPENYAIVAAAQHDYEGFYSAEIDRRRRLRYPPFRRLARLTFAHTSADAGLREAERVARVLREEVLRRGLPSTEVVGPAPALMQKTRGRFRWDVLVKSGSPESLVDGLDLGQSWRVEVDPASMS
ncbi:MAG: primosomal protein N' [Dehalococcoidia bacterium]|nr:primosomal protein N' [Dehalococcoidia bacterium]